MAMWMNGTISPIGRGPVSPIDGSRSPEAELEAWDAAISRGQRAASPPPPPPFQPDAQPPPPAPAATASAAESTGPPAEAPELDTTVVPVETEEGGESAQFEPPASPPPSRQKRFLSDECHARLRQIAEGKTGDPSILQKLDALQEKLTVSNYPTTEEGAMTEGGFGAGAGDTGALVPYNSIMESEQLNEDGPTGLYWSRYSSLSHRSRPTALGGSRRGEATAAAARGRAASPHSVGPLAAALDPAHRERVLWDRLSREDRLRQLSSIGHPFADPANEFIATQIQIDKEIQREATVAHMRVAEEHERGVAERRKEENRVWRDLQRKGLKEDMDTSAEALDSNLSIPPRGLEPRTFSPNVRSVKPPRVALLGAGIPVATTLSQPPHPLPHPSAYYPPHAQYPTWGN